MKISLHNLTSMRTKIQKQKRTGINDKNLKDENLKDFVNVTLYCHRNHKEIQIQSQIQVMRKKIQITRNNIIISLQFPLTKLTHPH